MTTPSIFYGDEDYELFIERSITKAATRGCGLGLFSLKATPGDLTGLTEEEYDACDVWGRRGDDDRTQLDAAVCARWAPGDPFGNLSELDDPSACLRRALEGDTAPASESEAMLLAGRAAADADAVDAALAAGLRRDRFDSYRRPVDQWTLRPAWTETHPQLQHMQDRCRDVCISRETRHPLCMRDRSHDGPHCSLTDEQREEISRVDLELLADINVRGTVRPALDREPYWIWTT